MDMQRAECRHPSSCWLLAKGKSLLPTRPCAEGTKDGLPPGYGGEGEDVVGDIGHKLAAGDHEDIDCHQCGAHRGRRRLRDVHWACD